MLSGKGIIVAVSPFLTYIATPPPRRSDRSRRKGGWKPAKLIKLDPSGVDEVEGHVSVTHNMSMSCLEKKSNFGSKIDPKAFFYRYIAESSSSKCVCFLWWFLLNKMALFTYGHHVQGAKRTKIESSLLWGSFHQTKLFPFLFRQRYSTIELTAGYQTKKRHSATPSGFEFCFFCRRRKKVWFDKKEFVQV